MRRNSFFYLVAAVLICSSCHKNAPDSVLEDFFEENILDKTFIITFANSDGNDITAQYADYNFVLKKGSDYYHGPLQVTRGISKYTGTWSSNSDYSQLVIDLPHPPEEFIFLSNKWKFTSKALPVLKFALWVSTGNPVELYMKRL